MDEKGLFGVIYQLGIEWFGDLANDQDGQGDDLLSVEGREWAEDFIWAVYLFVNRLINWPIKDPGNNSPRALKNGIPHAYQLRDNTQDIQMRSIRKKKIP